MDGLVFPAERLYGDDIVIGQTMTLVASKDEEGRLVSAGYVGSGLFFVTYFVVTLGKNYIVLVYLPI